MFRTNKYFNRMNHFESTIENKCEVQMMSPVITPTYTVDFN